jgi:hypothetical protein
MRKLFLFVMSLPFLSVRAEEDDSILRIDPELSTIRNGDALVAEVLEKATDTFLEGYIQALIDFTYYEYSVKVFVREHRVVLYDLPNNDLIAESIVAFVQDLPGVISVAVLDAQADKAAVPRKSYVENPLIAGVWFPQATTLFLPLIASPREPVYSVNYRYRDRVMGKHVAAISLGDDFPIFRWYGAFPWRGDLQIGISAGIWAVFNYDNATRKTGYACRMMNADYLVGLSFTYAVDRWAFRFRPYHISGHLGDECIVEDPNVFLKERKNPSFEAIDFIYSYQFSSGFRVYGGPGVVLHSDPSFRLKPFYCLWGSEIRLFGQKLYYHRLYGTPFLAIHVENWQQHSFNFDGTIKIGYEISKLQGVGRKMRLYLQYRHGYSSEGQFFNERVKYGEIGFSWGF